MVNAILVNVDDATLRLSRFIVIAHKSIETSFIHDSIDGLSNLNFNDVDLFGYFGADDDRLDVVINNLSQVLRVGKQRDGLDSMIYHLIIVPIMDVWAMVSISDLLRERNDHEPFNYVISFSIIRFIDIRGSNFV